VFEPIRFKSGVAETVGVDAGGLSMSGDVGKLGCFLVLDGRTATPPATELSIDIDDTAGEARFIELLDLCCPMLGCFLPPSVADIG
jgi:hypothetical protein